MNYGSSQFNKDAAVYPYVNSIFDSYLTQPILQNELSKYPEPGKYFRIKEIRYHPNQEYVALETGAMEEM